MGNACCKNITSDDDSDRDHIISNNNNNDILQGNNRQGQQVGGEFYINLNGAPPDDEVPYGSFSCGNKTQEQTALDRIYHRLALNVIDVAPGEPMIIQPAEIRERQKAYQNRLNQLKGILALSLLTKTGGMAQNSRVEQNLFNTHKLISTLKIVPPEPKSTCNHDINRQKLYHIPDRRRVEYDAIPQDEEELIKEYSLRSVGAVKSLAPTIDEPVITQFNI